MVVLVDEAVAKCAARILGMDDTPDRWLSASGSGYALRECLCIGFPFVDQTLFGKKRSIDPSKCTVVSRSRSLVLFGSIMVSGLL